VNGPRRMHGLSLIELMIAMMLGLIIMLGVIQVFAASRTSYAVTEGLSRVQENARFAMDSLERDLRMVGHFGCVNDRFRLLTAGQLNSHFAAGTALDFSQSLQGYEANGTGVAGTVNLTAPTAGWSPALPAWLAGLNPLPGSDIVVMRFLSPEGIPAIGFQRAGATVSVSYDPAKGSVLTQNGVAAPALFGVADCTYADVFEATAVASGKVSTSQAALNTTPIDFDSRYTASPAGQTVLYRAEAIVYYVGTGSNNRRSLFRARVLPAVAGTDITFTAPEELVEGIESIQLLYGLDGSADPARPSGHIGSQQVASSLATEPDWRSVGQVKLAVLAASPDPSASASAQAASANRMRLLGALVAPPADGRYRTLYDATISLRNRLPSTN